MAQLTANICVLAQWLQTDLGGATADLPVEKDAKATLEAVHKYGREQNGKFFNIHVAGWERMRARINMTVEIHRGEFCERYE